MEPTGEYVAAGIGEGMAGYDFTTDATSMVTALQTAMSATLPGTLKIVGINAMAGLKEGINSGIQRDNPDERSYVRGFPCAETRPERCQLVRECDEHCYSPRWRYL